MQRKWHVPILCRGVKCGASDLLQYTVLIQLYNWLCWRNQNANSRIRHDKHLAPNCVNYKTIAAVMFRLLYFWCLHLGNMFHFISSRASAFGFTMSWKHLQWKSYLSVTCVTLKSEHIYVCAYLHTVFMCSTCSCLFWHVAVQVRLQNAGSGIFRGETSTQHTCWHTHTRTLQTKSRTWSRVNNKFHYCSLMVWLNPLLVLTRLWEFR